jgi:hypothetical protein
MQPMLPAADSRRRSPADLRRLVNAVLSILKSDCHDEVKGYDVAGKIKVRKRRRLVGTL